MFDINFLKIEKDGKTIVEVDTLRTRSKGLVMLIGPNGAGKTTLLRALAGLDACEGSIKFQTRELKSFAKDDRAKLIAWVPSESALSFDITVRELVMLGRYPWHQGYPKPKDLEVVDSVLQKMGLLEFAKRNVASLSSGELQKAHIARALASEVSCLILDEPCSHLDIGARFELLSLLSKLDILILMSSHDHLIASKFSEQSICVASGKVKKVISGPPSLQDLANLFSIEPSLLQ